MSEARRCLAVVVLAGWGTGCCCGSTDLEQWYSDGRDAWDEPATEVSPADSMTPDQAAETLDYMNEFCGDTLCEGAFDYRFDELQCADRRCTLRFKARSYDRGKWNSEEIAFDVDGPVYDEYGSSIAFNRASSAALDAWSDQQGS